MRDKAIKQYKPAANPGPVKTRVLTLRGLKENDGEKIQALLGPLPGVQKTAVEAGAGRITVVYDSSRGSIFAVKKILWDNGYLARLASKT